MKDHRLEKKEPEKLLQYIEDKSKVNLRTTVHSIEMTDLTLSVRVVSMPLPDKQACSLPMHIRSGHPGGEASSEEPGSEGP